MLMGTATGKPGLAGVGGVLCDSHGTVWALFSKHVCSMESNEVEVGAILEALRIHSSSFHAKLVVESDSLNAINNN